MKSINKFIMLLLISAFVVFGSVGAAMAIGFDEVAIETHDPTIEDVSFFAGEGEFLDTMTTNETDPYLMNGFEFTGSDGNYYDTFIGAMADGFSFSLVELDIALESLLPSNTATLYLYAMSGTTVVDSDSITLYDYSSDLWDYHNLSVSVASGFDSVYIFEDMSDNDGIGEFFHIDNFTFEPTGEIPPIPEPSTMLLLGAGLIGMAALGRKVKRG